MTSSERVALAVSHLRHGLDELREAEKTSPGEVDHVLVVLVSHLRSWKPMALTEES